jgi:hypothetical protein
MRGKETLVEQRGIRLIQVRSVEISSRCQSADVGSDCGYGRVLVWVKQNECEVNWKMTCM